MNGVKSLFGIVGAGAVTVEVVLVQRPYAVVKIRKEYAPPPLPIPRHYLAVHAGCLLTAEHNGSPCRIRCLKVYVARARPMPSSSLLPSLYPLPSP